MKRREEKRREEKMMLAGLWPSPLSYSTSSSSLSSSSCYPYSRIFPSTPASTSNFFAPLLERSIKGIELTMSAVTADKVESGSSPLKISAESPDVSQKSTNGHLLQPISVSIPFGNRQVCLFSALS